MSRTTQLVVIGAAILVLTSTASHLVARVSQMRLKAGTPMFFGARDLPVDAMAAGGSLTFFGIHWQEVARRLGVRVQGWAVPVGSVVEMEVLQRELPTAHYTFLGISVSDLNDNSVSDYRADIVPFTTSARELWETESDGTLARQVMSQYPLKYLRAVYPTAGRSLHIMVSIREGLSKLRRSDAAPEPTDRAVLGSEGNSHDENITTWPEARRLRNVAQLLGSAGGSISFQGPKREALFRFLSRAAQAKVVVLVFPESPVYESEFVTPQVRNQFEARVAEAQKRTPEALWIRLDAVPELKSTDYYWDLVHLNAPGQAIATKIVCDRLEAAGIR